MKSLFSVVERLSEPYDRQYANGLYTAFKQAVLDELHDLNSDQIHVGLIDTADYAVNLATHDFLDDVAAGARVATFGPLTSPTITGGVFDSADFTFSSVTGDQSEGIVLWNHNGAGAAADSARMLILWFDTSITGMPVTPNGGNINCTVNASGWFSL